MGTRGLYGFRYKDSDKITYNHMDSYPDFLGNHFVTWLAGKSTEELKSLFIDIKMVSSFLLANTRMSAKGKEWCISRGIEPKEDWPSTLRDFQGDLEALEKYKVMTNDAEFIKDSLFCEYAYIANLDTNEFEFWIGAQTGPDPDNRYGTEPSERCCGLPGLTFFPCKCIGRWSLDDDIWENPDKIVEQMNSLADANRNISTDFPRKNTRIKRQKYENVALKIGRMGFFTDIHQCGAPTDSWPVNLYCEMAGGFRFYVAFSKVEGWSVDFTDDPEVDLRTSMYHVHGFKNQTETLEFIKNLLQKHSKNAISKE